MLICIVFPYLSTPLWTQVLIFRSSEAWDVINYDQPKETAYLHISLIKDDAQKIQRRLKLFMDNIIDHKY